MTEHRANTAAAFRRMRAKHIARYRNAELWVQRSTAREWALHYGKLTRLLERTQ